MAAATVVTATRIPDSPDPQPCSSARARWIECVLDHGVPGCVQRNRRLDAARLQPQSREHEAKCRCHHHKEYSRVGRRTFANLPDGSIITIKSNNLQTSYEGGDRNDHACHSA